MNEPQRLIADFLDGSGRTYGSIRQRILRYLNKHSASRFLDVEDICSEVVHILIRNFRSGRFRGGSRAELNAYIFRIVSNHVCDQVRKARRRSAMQNDLTYEEPVRHDIEGTLLTKLMAESVLADLEPYCRDLLKLKFLEGFSDQEIADKLRKSKNAVSTAICRCIKKAGETRAIRKMLKE